MTDKQPTLQELNREFAALHGCPEVIYRVGAFEKQHGGDHYKKLPIQPVEYIIANNIGFCEGNAIKYLTRWKDKGGVEDLKKAAHYIEMLIEQETKKNG